MLIATFALVVLVVIGLIWAISAFVSDVRLRTFLYIVVIGALVLWIFSTFFGVSLLDLRI